MKNFLFKFFFFSKFFKSKKRKKGERMVLMIAVLNRSAFNNVGRPVSLDTKTGKEFTTGKAAYFHDGDDYYVLLKNIQSNEYSTDAEMLGLAAHEVRHRVQRKFPKKLLSEKFLIKNGILIPNALAEIKELNSSIPNVNIAHELDSMVIEELFRKIFIDVNFEDENLDLDLCKEILLCSEENFLKFFGMVTT